jgi:2-C-methyl-D-erythritol 2,4-cyclodiphosphate synthase
MSELRVGLGIDLHAWADDRPLMLGGLSFPGEPGLAGHSDGDAVCHAVADALLGAAGLGDIGERFPDTDPAFEGIAGTDLLGRVVRSIRARGFEPASCDVTILAERPHVGPRRDEMRAALAPVLGLGLDKVSVKATRPEGLGLSGDGVGCFAVATVRARRM